MPTQMSGIRPDIPSTLAVFSPCRRWRYILTRHFGLVGTGDCLFIMLNPSTADEYLNDPTVSWCIRFAMKHGFQSLTVCNLFGWRATDPRELYKMTREEAIGPHNDHHIIQRVDKAQTVICAWGNHGDLYGRGKEVLSMVREAGAKPMALKLNKDKQPGHPLYLKGEAECFELTE